MSRSERRFRAFLTTAALWLALPTACPAQTAGAWRHADVARLQEAGHVDSALMAADSLLSLDSLRVDVLLSRAALRQTQGDREGQIADLRRALTRAPASTEVHMRIAEWFAVTGLHDSAAWHSGIAVGRVTTADKRLLLIHAGNLERIGRADSAAVLLKAYWKGRALPQLISLPPIASWRPALFELTALDGERQIWNTGRPTIFLFWSAASKASLDAFGDIQSSLPGSGVTWQFLPINVDRERAEGSDSAMVLRCRERKYKGPVWVDSGLTLMRIWGIERLPTVVFTGMSGEITSTVTTWGESIRDRVVTREMGSYTDSNQATEPRPDTASQRAQNLLGVARRAWETGNIALAIRQAGRAVSADPTHLQSQLHLAFWRWRRGDTAGARVGIDAALRVDSLSPEAMGLKGMLLWSEEKKAEATDWMHRAIAQDSAFVPGWRIVGWDAIEQGDRRTAETALSHLYALNNGDWGVMLIRALLAELEEPAAALSNWRDLVNAL